MSREFVVFLDRDGVINRKLPEDHFVNTWEDFEFLPGAQEAISTLNRYDIKAILITNQRGISLGLYSEVELQEMHARMTSAMNASGARLDAIYYCPHSKASCECRKPGTALFQQAFRDFPGAAPSTSVLVGDSLSDMLAAQSLGCKKVFIAGTDSNVYARVREAGINTEFCTNSLLLAVRDYIIPHFLLLIDSP